MAHFPFQPLSFSLRDTCNAKKKRKKAEESKNDDYETYM